MTRAYLRLIAWLPAVVATALFLAYVLTRDATPLGEWLTIWPSLLWCLGLVPLLALTAVLGHRRALIAGALATAGLVASDIEWRPLFRPSFDSTRRADLRLAIWNLAGRPPDAALDLLGPDVCFYQEVPAALPAAPRAHELAGVHDTALVSAHRLTRLKTRSVGPWTPPLVARLEVDGKAPIVLINVRLVLPSLVLDAWHGWDTLVREHAARVEQYRSLARLIDEASAEAGTPHVILAGDFNTPGGAASLSPLHGRLTDVWPAVGRGWGRTITSDWPLSRIDQCWVSSGLRPVQATAVALPGSDHRAVLVDVEIASRTRLLRTPPASLQ